MTFFDTTVGIEASFWTHRQSEIRSDRWSDSSGCWNSYLDAYDFISLCFNKCVQVKKGDRLVGWNIAQKIS